MPSPEILQQRLGAGLAALQLPASDRLIGQLLDYLALLQRWNAAYNLTAVRDPLEMVTRHLLDSLAIAPFVRGASLADIGSGAGLPGIPLALLAPERAVTLIDTNGKKARFLREAVRTLGLRQVTVQQARVQQATGTYDCITARAFATLAEMLEWGGHLLAPQGEWLALKGRYPAEEIVALPAGFEVARTLQLAVPGLDAQRHLVVIRRSGQQINGESISS